VGVTLPVQEANYKCEPDAINAAELTTLTPGAAGRRAGRPRGGVRGALPGVRGGGDRLLRTAQRTTSRADHGK